MVTLTLASLTRENRLVPTVKKFWHGAVNALASIFEGIEEARAMATRYDDLSRLSDAELAARGLARSDIPRVVIEGTRSR
jgi:lysophospholipid acyltransferase (LPLAT)-like uncharacterized protein